MLKVTCYKCQWSWSLNNDAVKTALDALEPDAAYYAIECPKCRRINKVTVKQLRRALPRSSKRKAS
jgi:ssDNA-binding Zn-finger/Zn-ribbon topoisomerase 1